MMMTTDSQSLSRSNQDPQPGEADAPGALNLWGSTSWENKVLTAQEFLESVSGLVLLFVFFVWMGGQTHPALCSGTICTSKDSNRERHMQASMLTCIQSLRFMNQSFQRSVLPEMNEMLELRDKKTRWTCFLKVGVYKTKTWALGSHKSE